MFRIQRSLKKTIESQNIKNKNDVRKYGFFSKFWFF